MRRKESGNPRRRGNGHHPPDPLEPAQTTARGLVERHPEIALLLPVAVLVLLYPRASSRFMLHLTAVARAVALGLSLRDEVVETLARLRSPVSPS